MMRKYFFTGLAILLPVVVTIAVVVFLVNLLTQPFLGMLYSVLDSTALREFLQNYPGAPQLMRAIGQILILVALFYATVLLGMFARWFFFRSLIKLGDQILHRIPIVNKVYKTTQDIINHIFKSKARSFKQVVMVPFPTSESYCVGFVSSDGPPICRAAVKKELISVFVPTTPNPTSGFLMLYPKEQVHFIDMLPEDALKYIISCGVIHSKEELMQQGPSVSE
jgi:uncharacterized membrane protein